MYGSTIFRCTAKKLSLHLRCWESMKLQHYGTSIFFMKDREGIPSRGHFVTGGSRYRERLPGCRQRFSVRDGGMLFQVRCGCGADLAALAA